MESRNMTEQEFAEFQKLLERELGAVGNTGDEEEIRNLLESELMPPDDMGYDFDNPHEGDDKPLSAEELTEELGKVLDTLFCEVFGNYRSVNIEVEL